MQEKISTIDDPTKPIFSSLFLTVLIGVPLGWATAIGLSEVLAPDTPKSIITASGYLVFLVILPVIAVRKLKIPLLRPEILTLKVKDLLPAFGSYLLLLAGLALVGWLLSIENTQAESLLDEQTRIHPWVFLVMAIINPVIITLVFQGLYLEFMLRHSSHWFAILALAAFFALAQFNNSLILPNIMLGLFLNYWYYRSRSVLLPMIIQVLHTSLVLLGWAWLT